MDFLSQITVLNIPRKARQKLLFNFPRKKCLMQTRLLSVWEILTLFPKIYIYMLLVKVDIVCEGVVVVKIMLGLRTSQTATFFLDH